MNPLIAEAFLTQRRVGGHGFRGCGTTRRKRSRSTLPLCGAGLCALARAANLLPRQIDIEDPGISGVVVDEECGKAAVASGDGLDIEAGILSFVFHGQVGADMGDAINGEDAENFVSDKGKGGEARRQRDREVSGIGCWMLDVHPPTARISSSNRQPEREQRPGDL